MVEKIENNTKEQYQFTYDELRKVIDSMKFSETSNVFGKEKESGVLQGIIDSV